MSRLIDADALARTLVAHKRVGWFEEEVEEEMKERVKGKDYCTFMAGYEYGLEIAVRIIGKTQTAYDIEKVVAMLEHEADLQEHLLQNASARCNDAQANIHRYAEQCYRNKAIEFVRKGGAE